MIISYYGTKYYGETAPKGWYETTAGTKAQAQRQFAKKHQVPLEWVKASPVYKLRREK
jgi:hypothetical protein